jgi:hypothetical protein
MEKVSSWRPNDWPQCPCDECTDKHTDEYGYLCDIPCLQRTMWSCREAGADAIMEALRKQPSVKYQFTDRGVPNPGFPISGTYYLIPEGEEVS